MNFRKTIDAKDIEKLIIDKIRQLAGSAVIPDHAKADILAELKKEIDRLPPAEKWNGPEKKPPVETMLLIRVEREGTNRRPTDQTVGIGTYHLQPDSTGTWRTISGNIIRWNVTGWQYMPHP